MYRFKSEDSQLVRAGIEAVLCGARMTENSNSASVVSNKGNLRDIVTQVDLEISKTLSNMFLKQGWNVVSEESSIPSSMPDTFWAIDPIDGTANFANGIPYYSISASWVNQNRPSLGFICAPALNEIYVTLSGNLACLNGKPLKHRHESKDYALTAMSFTAKASPNEYRLFKEINESTRGCLRTGSAAINLSWVASNRLQTCFGFGTKVWDVAAGLAINHAAGSEVQVSWHPDNVTLDYCVGSKKTVDYIIDRAKSYELWR